MLSTALPSTVLRLNVLTDVIPITQQSYLSCYYLYFEVRKLKTEAHRAEVTCYSQKAAWPGIPSRLSAPRALTPASHTLLLEGT